MYRQPDWLKKRLVPDGEAGLTRDILKGLSVATVCESGQCPNLNECFSKRRATFLILGRACSRGCGFCTVTKSSPEAVDPDEPQHICEAVRRLGSTFVVITSVTRDDLPDGGAAQFVRVIRALRSISDTIKIEVLVPDFRGSDGALKDVIGARPDIFAHNIETVQRLYPIARPGSDYAGSLRLLKKARQMNGAQITKSGIMVGLGETDEEIIETMTDLRRQDCDILTIGQYLSPSPANLPVRRFVRPEAFGEYEKIGLRLGFRHVSAGPFVRSSYYAEEIYSSCKL